MTEKRFMVDDAGELIDKETAQFIEYGEKVCDLLNEQHETITTLTSALKELREIGDYQAYRIKELTEENEQLEQEIKELKEAMKRLMADMMSGGL